MSINELNKEKPSERIRFGIDALKEWESRPECVVDMRHFIGKTDELDICYACLGGAAAFKKHRIEDPFDYHDSYWSAFTNTLLEVDSYEASLDCARLGRIGHMFERMHLNGLIGESFDRNITDYHKDRVKFFEDLEKLASDLEEDGY